MTLWGRGCRLGGMMGEPRLKEFGDCDMVLGPGVYALFLYGECVYIGKAKRVLHRIYAHKNLWERVRKREKLPRGGPLANIPAIRRSVASTPVRSRT